MGEDNVQLGDNVFLFCKDDIEDCFDTKQREPIKIETGIRPGMLVYETGNPPKIGFETEDPKRSGWLHSITGKIVLNDEQRKALKEAFPPELFRIHMLSEPIQNTRSRSYTITAKDADREDALDAFAISAYLCGKSGKAHRMNHCKIERKKREYRHTNPSKYNKRKKRKYYYGKIQESNRHFTHHRRKGRWYLRREYG